jgi:hypothetical protein
VEFLFYSGIYRFSAFSVPALDDKFVATLANLP